MKEIKGNIWDVYRDYDAICCTTNYIVKSNGELVMGAGIAKEFSNIYPWLAKNWGKRVSRDWKENCHPGVFVTLMKYRPHLVYFGTKWDWKNPSNLELIEASAWSLLGLAIALDWKKVLLPNLKI